MKAIINIPVAIQYYPQSLITARISPWFTGQKGNITLRTTSAVSVTAPEGQDFSHW